MGRVKERAILPVALQIFTILELAAVVAAVFFYLPPARGFALPEYARIIIFHVPCAMVAVVAYIVSTLYALFCLTRSDMVCDIKSAASASLGLIFTALATISGMIFAKIEWGSAWNWDPRETSILMLMIVYVAYIALRGAIPNRITRARISAAYNILACMIMPFLVFILPRISAGLHPTTTLTDSSSLSSEYRIVLMGAMLGFLLVYIWAFRYMVRKNENTLGQGKK